METLIGYLFVMGGLLAFSVFFPFKRARPQQRQACTPSQRCMSQTTTQQGGTHG